MKAVNQCRVPVRSRKLRRGAIAVFALIFMAVLLIFLAFSVDVGHISQAEAELQSTTDAAARSGARALYKSPSAARNAAIDMAARNTVSNDTIVLTAQDVEIGMWDDAAATFTVLTGANESQGNAVRVTCRHVLLLYFARLFGNFSLDLDTTAIAKMEPKICGGFIGIDNVDVGSVVDSYKSSAGSYASQTPGDNGDVCSNGSIDVSGGAIHGDARPGIGYGVRLLGSGHVTGDITPHLPYTYPAIDIGDADIVNDNNLLASRYVKNGGLSISSSESTSFPGGVLYLNYMSVNGEFRITGPTTIYVEQYVDIAGQGILNDTFIPSNLKIYILNPNSKQSKVSGNGSFYGVIYAPYTNLKLTGNGAFYGSAVAKTLIADGSGGTHFDEDITLFHDKMVKPRLVQ